MIPSILKALYKGDLNFSTPGFPKDKGYRDTIHSISDIKVELKGKLSAEYFAVFEKYCDLQSELNAFESHDSFRSGFCAGALVMLEVMTSPEVGVCCGD